MAICTDQIALRDLDKNLVEMMVDQLRDRSNLDRTVTMIEVHAFRWEAPTTIETWSGLQFFDLAALFPAALT
jgi:hypothetical protein